MAADEKEEEKIDLKDRRNDGSAMTGVEKAPWHTDGWKKIYRERKRRCRRRLREDAALHPQSSVRLHKYCVHGRVAGSQVNMTYEYCSSHSLPSCPPQLLMCGSELAQLYLRPSSPSLQKTNGKHRKMDVDYVVLRCGNLFLQEKQRILIAFCSTLSLRTSRRRCHSAHYKPLHKCSHFNYLYFLHLFCYVN